MAGSKLRSAALPALPAGMVMSPPIDIETQPPGPLPGMGNTNGLAISPLPPAISKPRSAYGNALVVADTDHMADLGRAVLAGWVPALAGLLGAGAGHPDGHRGLAGGRVRARQGCSAGVGEEALAE